MSLNDDAAVVRHEIAHVLVWYLYGGAIGPLMFSRSTDGLLDSRAKLLPRDPTMTMEDLWFTMSNELAIRLLAGEAAARRYLGLSRDQICSCGLVISAASDLNQVLRGHENNQEDLVRVLFLANDSAGSRWYRWIAEQLHEAQQIVDAYWQQIDLMGAKLERRIPKASGTNKLFGIELIKLLRGSGILSRITPAVEIESRCKSIRASLLRLWYTQIIRQVTTRSDILILA